MIFNGREVGKKILTLSMCLIILISFVGLWKNEVKEKNAMSHSAAEKDLEAKRRREGWINTDGVWYKPNENIDTYLLIGADSTEPLKDSGSYDNTIQSDFLVVTIVNNEDNSVILYQINRDTMSEIPVLGVTGQYAGTITAQLALAHTYGNGLEKSCENTVDAVETFLGGVEIDHYISLNMGGIPYINDMVGGVEVTVADDFTGIDDTLIAGETVVLYGQHALNYLRVRKGLEDSSNISRMNRHRAYLSGLFKKFEKIKNIDVSSEQINTINKYVLSDCTVNQLNTLLINLSDYELKDYVFVSGQAKKGTEFIEFYADEDALKQQVIDLFYVLAE